ncbi:hypothetical protein M124_4561 [Bacteroides fragilis str. 3988T(B)14]|uniref:Uncharacterized protein n=1 Tax=Bacteroides fragilis str. 3988T(B)14 TaxID=1339315 RepID=A0A015SWI4_BACFG|nr:hypothetical protein M124_4561 [Bacteroides fragilis str. 3988T(B)14]
MNYRLPFNKTYKIGLRTSMVKNTSQTERSANSCTFLPVPSKIGGTQEKYLLFDYKGRFCTGNRIL